MTIQHYIKKRFSAGFEKNVQLLYVCKADQRQTSLPTVLHAHEDRLELVYLCRGQGIHRIGGRIYHTRQGDLLVYNSGVVHDECASPDRGMSVYTCALKGLQLPGLPPNHLLDAKFRPILQCGDWGGDVLRSLKMMHQYVAAGQRETEAVGQYLLKALLLLILHQIPPETQDEESEECDLISYVKAYIDAHFLENLTLRALSQTMHMSPSYLSHRFKKQVGFAPIQYIIRRRIGRAQALLISTDESITEIAAKSGYDNTSHFNSTFKKTVGMTPKNYRKYYVGQSQYKNLDRLRKLNQLSDTPPNA